MSPISIALFFIYIYGLGFTATKFLKNAAGLEKHLMRLGIGLGLLPVLIVLVGFLRIPLDWKIILAVSVIPMMYFIAREYKTYEFKFVLKKSEVAALVMLLIFAFTLFMYVKGSFSYPYLEDEDPWAHAAGAMYVSHEKTIFEPKNADVISYISPYPPAYDALMGILYQTSGELIWTLKFFNALIISLGIIFFFYFAKRFMHDVNKALLATFFLASVPSYLSHFIWAHALIVTLFFPTLYAIEMIKEDRRWMYLLGVLFAGLFLTQPDQPIKLGIMVAFYYIIKTVSEKKFSYELPAALCIGILVSLMWWGGEIGHMVSERESGNAIFHNLSPSANIFERVLNFFPPGGGSATRAYTFDDFFVAKSRNLINNPVGIGVTLSILALIGIVAILFSCRSLLQENERWKLVVLFWLLFTFLGINSVTFNLPVGLYAFRFWMLFAIPLSIVAAEGAFFLASNMKKYGVPMLPLIGILVIFVAITSFVPKYQVNTSQWYPGQWTNDERGNNVELPVFLWLKTLPKDTPVFFFSDPTRIVAMDKYNCFWCEDELSFRKSMDKPAEEVRLFLKKKGYQYMVLSGTDARVYGINSTNNLVNNLLGSGNFQIVQQSQGAFVMKVS